ncbi:MAG: hypothetical protein HXL32_05340, partial [Prevotellaceae bacterium]|nr:hypothetical protein [Prevotellaceae bacterium]
MNKTSDPQTCNIVLITPAEHARRAVAKYRAQCNEDVYHELLDIIETESAKGATKLSLSYTNDEKLPNVVVSFAYDKYIYNVIAVRVNVAALINHADLIKRFESDGFDVKTMSSEKYGTIID